MSEPVYSISEKEIKYSNDFEYRASLRKLFCMVLPKENQDSDLDEITADEQNYDGDSVCRSLDFIYEKTESNTLFQQLYDLGAAKMLSLDRTIGLSVLFSYDYMSYFHNCLCVFFETPEQFNEECESFVALKQKIT
jgi:hypothetical protein